MMNRAKIRRPFARFSRDEAGVATIETLIWLPVVFAFLVLVADASMIFNGQARLLRIVQDANRALSVGRLHSTTEVEDQIKEKIASIDPDPVVSTTITNGVISTTLTVPASSLDIIGWFAPLLAAKVTVKGEHYVEY